MSVKNVRFYKKLKMTLLDLSCLCTFLVFGHLSDGRVLILRDYDDEPFVLDHVDGSVAKVIEPKHEEAISISSQYRPKKMRSSKKTILQYGRHTYHLDDFSDLQELRSKISEFNKPLKDDSISYDYVDIKDWRAIDSAKDGVAEYPKDLIILSETPLRFCNGEECEEDRKAFRKFDESKDWKHTKNRLRFIKRFQIVDNRHKSSKKSKHSKYDSSEEYNHKKKKSSKKHKKKKQDDSAESMDSNSVERSSKSWESNKKKKYSSEESREFKRNPKKKHVDDSTLASIEALTDESSSIENIPKIKKKHKKKNKKKKHGSPSETERKTMALEDDYFMQGNKIFHSNDRKKKKKHDEDTRRRLQHFMPKRYHWEPEEIHDLGYFWFNGPKGAYPAPKLL